MENQENQLEEKAKITFVTKDKKQTSYVEAKDIPKDVGPHFDIRCALRYLISNVYYKKLSKEDEEKLRSLKIEYKDLWIEYKSEPTNPLWASRHHLKPTRIVITYSDTF